MKVTQLMGEATACVCQSHRHDSCPRTVLAERTLGLQVGLAAAGRRGAPAICHRERRGHSRRVIDGSLLHNIHIRKSPCTFPL